MAAVAGEYLDGRYHEKNPTFHVEDSAGKAREILKMMRQESLTPRTIAEVGCGAGEILVQLSRELPEARFTGYEVSPQGFELCRTRESERVRFFNRDAPLDAAELLLCVDVFEHVEDYFGFLRDLREKASSFIFHIPLDMNAQMVIREEPIARVRDAVGHLHYFSKDTALAALERCGYNVQSWFYTAHGSNHWRAKLLWLPRRAMFAIAPSLTVRALGGYSLLVYAKAR
jgi:cyclopropane fatty-acyl-phospholipid synthase-like methyltransferase